MSQNWTPRMREEFQKRRGYDPLPLLPTVAGRTVDSPEVSERFLWDMRKTIAELLNENYAGRLRELAHRHGMQLSIEAYGDFPFDELSYAGRADCRWASSGWGLGRHEDRAADGLGGAHLRQEHRRRRGVHGGHRDGQMDEPSVFDEGPGRRRLLQRRQPLRLPSLRPPAVARPRARHDDGAVGRPLRADRDVVGADPAVARVSGPLQPPAAARAVRGRPLLPPDRKTSPGAIMAWPMPRTAAYEFDGCAPEVVLTRMTVRDGRLVLPDGMSYRLLVLPPGKTMTPELLGKIKELVEAGRDGRWAAAAQVAEPERLPAVRRPGAGACGGTVGQLRRQNGYRASLRQGRIIWGKTPETVLAEMGVPPDFRSSIGTPPHYLPRQPSATSIAPRTEPRCTSSPTASPRPLMCNAPSG